MPTCPNGHQSAADDWCEVCGQRMTAPSGPPGAPASGFPSPPPPPGPGGYGFPPQGGQAQGPPGPPEPPGQQGYGYPGPGGGPQEQAELCPQCGTPREAQAPFCEECRYNFLTHTPTAYAPPPQPGPPQQGPPQPGPPGYPQPGPPGGDGGYGYPQAPQPPGPGAHGQSPPGPPQQGPPQPGPPGPPQPGPHQPGPPGGYGYPQAPQQAGPQAPPQHGPAQGGPPSPPSGDWMLSPPAGPAQQPPAQQGPPQPGPPGYPQQGAPEQGRPQPHAGPGPWTAVIAPDREYFTAMMVRSGPEAAALNLPAFSAEQELPLTGHQITIGRRRQSTGDTPDIDLGRPPEDPGVSHQHALLVSQPDGSWSVVDQNSTNGTTVNGGEDPIQPFVPVPLRDGDQVHVGAWTTITLRHG